MVKLGNKTLVETVSNTDSVIVTGSDGSVKRAPSNLFTTALKVIWQGEFDTYTYSNALTIPNVSLPEGMAFLLIGGYLWTGAVKWSVMVPCGETTGVYSEFCSYVYHGTGSNTVSVYTEYTSNSSTLTVRGVTSYGSGGCYITSVSILA